MKHNYESLCKYRRNNKRRVTIEISKRQEKNKINFNKMLMCK